MTPSLFVADAVPSASLGTLDLILFFVAVIGVIALGIWQGNKGNDGGRHGGTAVIISRRTQRVTVSSDIVRIPTSGDADQ